MSSTRRLIVKVFQVLGLVVLVRGSVHIIRLIILATLGLGGLVLYQAVSSGKPINHITSAIGKRSLNGPRWPDAAVAEMTPSIQLAFELDDRECARQYMCQVAAKRRSIQSIFPQHISLKSENDRIALETFKSAAEFGVLHSGNPAMCHEKFKKCPYQSVDQMNFIIDKYT